ncbi:eukaryotic translation initiation factor 4 gamma 2-like [Amphiura filiformis]|uniref:eukaryotic translation initiation factor 4 gamma 2-like n=1 Tax=Amphiura filiformis TaxID=82378 RepID=UPI003B219F4C
MYAQLCRRLDEDAPSFEPPGSTNRTFRRLLINKCQDEFENRSRAFAAYEVKRILTPEEEEQRNTAKLKMLGNIQFIGELGNLEMLHESILYKCIKQLLDKRGSETLREKAEDLECLCKIMNTVGRRLDHDKAKIWMNQYFHRMERFSENFQLPSRIRFMLQDCIELRNNNWISRRTKSDHGPRTIRQIHQDAAKDMNMRAPPQQNRPPHSDFFGPMNGGGMHSAPGWLTSSGMNDGFFLQDTMTAGVGTGPGLIDVGSPFDSFSSGPSYSPKMNRHQQNQQQQPRNMSRGGDRQNQGYNNNHNPYNNPPPRHQQPGGPQDGGVGNNNSGGVQGYGNRQNQQGQRDNTRPPRLAKMNSEQLNLRPNSTGMILKPQGPSMLPPSAKAAPMTSMSSTPLTNNSTNVQPGHPGSAAPGLQPAAFQQIPIRQVPATEKEKKVKKPAPTRQELLKTMETILDDFLSSNGDDLTKAVTAFKDTKIPNKHLPAVLCHAMMQTISKNDADRENVSKLMAAIKKEGSFTSTHFLEGFTSLLERSTELEAEVPLIKSHMATFAAHAVYEDVVTLAELADLLENGAYYPLFLLCMQRLHKLKDKEWLTALYNDSKVNMMKMLPEIDQNKERMMEILDDKGLSFLFPLLRVQADIWKQIQADPNPSALYKWIRENVATNLHQNQGFVNALTTSILKYVTGDTTLANGVDASLAPDKQVQEKEKNLLEKFKPVLQKFIHESSDLQLSALYALQVHCHLNNFPKGMLLRFFINLYNMEVIEEEAYMTWKEDITDEFPGKGQALFQVNQWLMWLATAEEEEDSDDDDED